ncbi:MAG: peptidyl-tRNA hydrolase [Terrestrivirus sp.]|uniref:peptidyl-tRNA hydrolase n=1 Tax=Terrestrivirus sp. TaxID=2487775 RepID=A0A3G4ZM76_9VIRU|nr:MAG: peptidyl-tRNA hydrolase [Terrestrivirus sp.]
MTEEVGNDLVMYIIINNDLNMSSGKIGSQIGHIVHKYIKKIERYGYENFPPNEEYISYMKWDEYNGGTKIILKASEKKMRELINKFPETLHFIDTGNTTEVPNNSLTIMCFPPSNKFKRIMKEFRLLQGNNE